MRKGFFEEESNAGGQQVFRLRWHPTDPLSEHEKRYAHFIRWLITRGRLTEQIDAASGVMSIQG